MQRYSRITISIIVSLLLLSCSAVNRVNNSPKKQARVVNDYLRKNPLKNDTLVKVIAGKEVVVERKVFDTVIKESSIPNCPPDKIIYQTVWRDRKITDTVKVEVKSREFEKAIQADCSEKDYQLSKAEKELRDMELYRDKWRKRFFILLGISIAVIFLSIKFL